MSFCLPVLPPAVPRRGSALWRAIGRTVLRLGGFRVTGNFPDRAKLVVAVAPHTSNWDFVFGAAAMFALDLKCTFIGKHTLFVWPFSAFLRWMGGVPVDRSAARGLVGEAVAAFAQEGARLLVIAPEGTRRKVERFKTGFLHIAKGAGVPVVLVSLDYATRCVQVGPMREFLGEVEDERIAIEAHFARVQGRNRP